MFSTQTLSRYSTLIFALVLSIGVNLYMVLYVHMSLFLMVLRTLTIIVSVALLFTILYESYHHDNSRYIQIPEYHTVHVQRVQPFRVFVNVDGVFREADVHNIDAT